MKNKGFTLIELPVVRKRAFTLIELLVTIAIVGILSVVILVALNSARKTARDARVKSDLAQMRRLAETIANDNNGSYQFQGTPKCSAGSSTNKCLPGTTFANANETQGQIAELALDIRNLLGFNNNIRGLYASSSVISAVFLAALPSGQPTVYDANKSWWCVDTQGTVKEYPLGWDGGASAAWTASFCN